MSETLTEARSRLHVLDRAVASEEVGEDRRLWGGAGLGVVAVMPEPPYDESVKYVVTSFAPRLSWLVRALWTVFRPLLDSMTKFEFFGRLGNAALRYQQRAGAEESARDLLGAVVHEAYEIIDDIENGRFHCVPVVSSSGVYDDLLPAAQHDDALSVDEFEQWFRQRGFR